MFKKKPQDSTEKVTRQVVKEITEKRGGVETTTTTITCTKDDFGTAFKKLNLDPAKFHSGGTSITRQIIYTNSSGDKEILEETVETFDDPKVSATTKAAGSGKSLTEKMGLHFGKSTKPSQDSATEPSTNNVQYTQMQQDVQPSGKFEKECLDKHNEYRAKHGVPKLTLSSKITSYAREWAKHLADTDRFEHRTEGKYGENIYSLWSSDPDYPVSGDEPVESWYSEINGYTFGREPENNKAGHFTQVIWRDSKRLGCAWAKSDSGKLIVVANYDPAGNFIGRYTENVPPPKQ